jgi:hypothetical protein
MENSRKIMYRFKKMLPLLALLLFMAGTDSVWSAEERPGGSPSGVDPAGGSVSSSSVLAASSGSEASEPLSGDGASALQDGAVETLPPSYNPFNYVVFKPLWALTSFIGDFNPIGKHVSTPLEEAFPGLRIKGFINSITQINTTATDHLAGGARNKDWRLQKQEFRAQLELKYQLNENLEFVNVNNFQYDGAYDFQSAEGLYRSGSPNQVNYTQGKRIVREAYVRGNYGEINFTIGKQIVNWGKMDGKVIDIVNGADGRDVVDFHIGDYEWRAIGQWMANVAYRPLENLTVNLLWNPDFQPNVGPAYGSPYWFPWVPSARYGTPLSPEVVPSGFHSFTESEAGVRVDSTIGGLSLSGIYYNGYDRDPVFYKSDGMYHHERLNRLGYAVDYGTSVFGQRLIIRSEGLYSNGRSFNTTDPLVHPFAPNAIVKKDQVKLGLALETSFFSDENKIDFLYQPIWTNTLDYNFHLVGVPSRNDFLHVINLSHAVRATNDKLTLGATFYIHGGSNNGGWSANYAAGWKFNDYLKATLAYTDYQGNNDQIPWGVYNKWKNVGLDVKYEW